MGTGFGGKKVEGHRARPPRIRFSDIKVGGGYDRDVFSRYLRMNYSSVQKCYLASLTRKPGSKGTVALSLSINSQGRVAKVGVLPSSTLTDKTMRDCVVKAYQGAAFAPAKPPQVEGFVTFDFSPGN